MNRIVVAGALAAALILPGAAEAELKHEQALKELVASQLRAIAENPLVIDAVAQQNAANSAIAQPEIDKLDQQWRAEVDGQDKALISRVMATELSNYLKQVSDDAGGLYTEIIVMDGKGLNVGQSSVTSDYWQGDEAKWLKTYPVGADAVFVDEIEKDESTQQLQSQVSFSIVDPASHQVIGAITFGVNLDLLGG
ncbi:MAG TPA: hypothetical protein VH835_18320 [Dongiaceae bacterium]|jgi:hypothetical protein